MPPLEGYRLPSRHRVHPVSGWLDSDVGDPTPLLQPHYRVFNATTGRSAPGLGFGTLASRFWPLELLPWHPRTGSCSSAQKPASASRPLYAGRRLPSTQAPDRLVPEESSASGFGGVSCFSTRHQGFTYVRLSDAYLPESYFGLLIQRSPPRLLNAAAWTGLGPAPESRSRGAYPHLSRSSSTRLGLHFCTPSVCVCSTTKIQHHDERET